MAEPTSRTRVSSIAAFEAIDKAILHGARLSQLADLAGCDVRRLQRIRATEGLHTITRDASAKIVMASEDWAATHPVATVNEATRRLIVAKARELAEAEYQHEHLAEITGITLKALRSYRDGRTPHITPEAANRILAIDPSPNLRVASTLGVSRRLRALMRWGYTFGHLGRELGVTASEVTRMADMESDLDNEMRLRVAQLFSRLEHIPGPSETATQIAANRGWPLPFQYDELAIDNGQARVYLQRSGNRVEREDRETTIRREMNELAASLAA